MKFNLKFSSWFSSCCLNNVKHPVFGSHKVTPLQMKHSSADYKNKLYKCMKKAYERGDINEEIIKQNS